MTTKQRRNRWLTNIPLLCLMLIPALFWYFAANMAIYRYDARERAVEIMGEVTDQKKIDYTCEDSDGNRRTCTHWTYRVRFNVYGEQIERQLLDARFDPDYIHHTDGIDHAAHPVGAKMRLLLRQDLNNAVAPDSFWSAYLMPVILAGSGCFVSFFMVVAILLGWERRRAPLPTRTVKRN